MFIPTNFNDAVRTGFAPYMEAEYRAKSIKESIADFKYIIDQHLDPNDYIDEVLKRHGLTEDELTESECTQIERAINGYYY